MINLRQVIRLQVQDTNSIIFFYEHNFNNVMKSSV